jgi:hypothetical protein
MINFYSREHDFKYRSKVGTFHLDTVSCKNNDLYFEIRKLFPFNSSSEYPFFVSGYQNFYQIRNNFLIGAYVVVVDHVSQLDKALSFFTSGVPFMDKRFPKTYSDIHLLSLKGLYPFEYSEEELIIDLREESVTFVPDLKEESVTFVPDLKEESVTFVPDLKEESVTFVPDLKEESVTYCPCGCGNVLLGRQKSFSSSCRKRLSRLKNLYDGIKG